MVRVPLLFFAPKSIVFFLFFVFRRKIKFRTQRQFFFVFVGKTVLSDIFPLAKLGSVTAFCSKSFRLWWLTVQDKRKLLSLVTAHSVVKLKVKKNKGKTNLKNRTQGRGALVISPNMSFSYIVSSNFYG